MKKKIGKKSIVGWKKEFADVVGESLKYIVEQKKFIYAVALVFGASSFIGFIYADVLDRFLANIIKEIISQAQDLDFLEMVWFIFSNNVTSSLFGILFGIFFGIFPFFNALFNGALLGYVYSKASAIDGYGVIWRIFPHGILELPAVFISLGLGMHLGAALFARNAKVEIVERGRRSLRAFLVVIVPLLIAAAIIESAFMFFVG